MALGVASYGEVRFVEGSPEEPVLRGTGDSSSVIEVCFSARARAALLYPANLTPAFFDLSSGEAGEILQKFRQYGIRLAVVCAPGSVRFSSRFGELMAEESSKPYFGAFPSREQALDWLEKHANRSIP